MFPFQEWIQIEKDFHVHYGDILEFIGPGLTASRKEKISSVVASRSFSHALVLEDIFDRGNTSAVMRSAEAFGFSLVHLIQTTEKFKESQRTTAGADKWLEVSKWKSTGECVQELKKQGKTILATHLDSTAKSIHEFDFNDGDYAVVLGNEHRGISDEMKQLADHRIILPMQGFVQSFNISVAGALICQTIRQQIETRRTSSGAHAASELNETKKNILSAIYFLRTQDSAKDVLYELHGRGQIKGKFIS